MRKLAAAPVLALLMLGACSDPPKTTLPEVTTPVVAAPDLPSGLYARKDDQLRIYDATSGKLTRTVTVPGGPGMRFSADWAYAAEVENGTGRVVLYGLQNDKYVDVGGWSEITLGTPATNVGFVARTGLLAVELNGGDGGAQKTVSVDPRRPAEAPKDLTVTFVWGWDSYGEGASVENVLLSDPPGRVNLHRTSRELLDATIIDQDVDQDGASELLYQCAGPEVAEFTVLCHGEGTGVVAALTAGPADSTAALRRIANLKGREIDAVFRSPDSKSVLAQTETGFYTTSVQGGKLKRAFGPLPGKPEILSWS
ncbi:hypothetical protein [Actinoplanes friuliensis]|uniref:Lipoprotein n=1 Tax=Actinoplanes friuliensis DSM 7358 TaxID=1246995 RepID=U5W865_9ACTN|nr:hypothetical protein [Actinoplanes friuliensis]AGZ45202.1 hypothetical protein AFR_34730 [Actinoplanes friuliensis DSM 7358]